MTHLWQQTETGADFIQQMHGSGCLLAEGVPRHPFMVVDENGRSFDLVRQLKGVRIKEVRQRLRDAKLIPEKQAIEIMRQRQEGSSDASNMHQPTADNVPDKAKRFAQFRDMGTELTQPDAQMQNVKRQRAVAGSFLETNPELTATAQKGGAEQEEFIDPSGIIAEKEESAKTPNATRDEYRKTLQAFTQAEEELLTDNRPDADKHKQQETAWQFIGNQDDLTADQIQSGPSPDKQPQRSPLSVNRDEPQDVTSDDERLRQLILKQKEFRKRVRQRSRKRGY